MTSREEIISDWIVERNRWGLNDWVLRFSNQKRQLGYCKPRSRVISISLEFMRTNPYSVMRDTLLHEIEPALPSLKTGPTHHDNGWREIAKRVGCRPERCASGDELYMPRGKYVGVCPSCNKTVQFYRKVRRSYSCNECGRGYDSRYRFRIIPTEKYDADRWTVTAKQQVLPFHAKKRS